MKRNLYNRFVFGLLFITLLNTQAQVQLNDFGTSNAYEVTYPANLNGIIPAGMEFTFRANNANTGASTLLLTGTTTRSIVKNFNTPLDANDIKAGHFVRVIYDATNLTWQMLSSSANPSLGSGGVIQNQNIVNQTADFRISGSGSINGNVGIGMLASPSAQLRISDPTNSNGQIRLYAGTATGENGSDGLSIYIDANNASIQNYESGRLTLGTGGSAIKATLLPNGNFGLKDFVSNPASKLAVDGNATIGTNYYNIVAPTNGLLVEGNVGIGTSSPSTNLHVVGDARITNLSASGTVFADNTGKLFVGTISGSQWTTNPAPGIHYLGGAVGIFTSIPGFLLDVNGDIRATDNIRTNKDYLINGSSVLKFPLNSVTSSIFVGGAGNSTTDGTQNVLIGQAAGSSMTTGYGNNFIGYSSGNQNTIGQNNIFVGVNAGSNNINGNSHVFIGFGAGQQFNTGASGQVFIGANAGNQSNSTNGGNTYIGQSSGSNNTSGNYNTYIGAQSGASNSTASQNVLVGFGAGFAINTGASNVMIGKDAGSSTTNGSQNVIIGQYSGIDNTVGSRLVIIGDNANVGANNLTNAIAIGYNASVTNSNQMALGGTGSDAVNVGIGLNNPNLARLQVSGSVNNTGAIFQTGNKGVSFYGLNDPVIGLNQYEGATSNLYSIGTQRTSEIRLDQTNDGIKINFSNGLAGSAGTNLTMTQRLFLKATGELLLGSGNTTFGRFAVRGTFNKGSAGTENVFNLVTADVASPMEYRFGMYTDATATNRHGYIEVDEAGTKRNLVLQPNGGNVGIGVTVPTVPLQIERNGSYAEINMYAYGSTDPANPYSALVLGRARNTQATPQAVIANDVLGALVFRGNFGGAGSWHGGASQIRADATETFNATSGGSRLIFSTVPNTTTSPQPRMYIDNSGTVSIGDFIASSKLAVDGSFAVGNAYRTLTAPPNGMIVQGNVGIGTSFPGYKLQVLETSASANYAPLWIDFTSTATSGGNTGINVDVSGTSASGTPTLYGIYSYASKDGAGGNIVTGIYGEASSTLASQSNTGVWGESKSTLAQENYGVYGRAYGSSNANYGVTGISTGAGGMNNYGGYFLANNSGASTNSYGVFVTVAGTAINKIGVYSNVTPGANAYSGIFLGGFVGIGTTAPTSPLVVSTPGLANYVTQIINPANAAGNNGLLVNVGNSSNATTIAGFVSAGIPRMVVRADGNVGIASTSPTARLDVGGNFKLGTNGTVLQQIINVCTTTSATPINVPANGSIDLSFTANNTATTDVVYATSSGLSDGLLIQRALISALNIATIRVRNVTASPIGIVNTSFCVLVVKP